MSSEPIARRIADTDCLVNSPDHAPLARLVLAHGAGAAMDSPFMAVMASLLCERSLEVIRFEFPYMAKRRLTGRRAPPNPKPVLLAAWKHLISALVEEGAGQAEGLPLFIGGKSMGGRMATMVAETMVADTVADTVPVRGVVCLGYPFHPRGKPEKVRTEHLLGLTTPTLIVQGTRDPLGMPDEVAGYELSTAILMAWLETGDHDLKPLLKSGFSHDDHLRQAADRIAAFIRLAL